MQKNNKKTQRGLLHVADMNGTQNTRLVCGLSSLPTKYFLPRNNDKTFNVIIALR